MNTYEQTYFQNMIITVIWIEMIIHLTLKRLLFEDIKGRTRINITMLFPTAEARNEAAEFGAVKGGNQTLNRLAAFLKKQKRFVPNPRDEESTFKMWVHEE